MRLHMLQRTIQNYKRSRGTHRQTGEGMTRAAEVKVSTNVAHKDPARSVSRVWHGVELRSFLVEPESV